MMALAALFVRWGLSENLARPFAAAAIVLLVCAATAGLVRCHNARVIERHEVAQAAKAEAATRKADAAAQVDQDKAAAAAAAARKEFDDATRTMADEPLTRRQRLDLCDELRQAGRATSHLSACRDADGRGEAGPRREDTAR